MKQNSYSRRAFIGKCLGVGSLMVGGTFFLASCASNESKQNKEAQSEDAGAAEKAPATGDPCDDISGLSAEEKEQRKRFGYVAESAVPGSHCGNCRLYIPPKSDGACGGCLLFKGPVRETGYCAQYEAKG